MNRPKATTDKRDNGKTEIMRNEECVLVLGGAGLVGSQIVREVARELPVRKIVVASLVESEVKDFVEDIAGEFPDIAFVGAWGNVFVREAFSQLPRKALLESAENRDKLYEDLFGAIEEVYERSSLVKLIRAHAPDVVVDCINTATAISYQDSESISKKTRDLLGAIKNRKGKKGAENNLLKDVQQEVSTLLISQGTSQLIRHVRILNGVMTEVGTRLYLKIGTTGTGGMGFNIPYTHSEDKPSVQLMTKTAMAFAHTGLMFLMARTPQGPVAKEIKPAGMIGYRRVGHQTVKYRGETQYIYESKIQPLKKKLRLRSNAEEYEKSKKLKMVGVDTGENGFFARGEFEAITSIDQMEFLTPEEIAQQAVLEIKGSNTGLDVIAGIDSNIMNPSYRAGILRQTALEKLSRLESERNGHSVALGQLGPPELSKLLYESYLLKLNFSSLEEVLKLDADEVAETLMHFVKTNHELRNQIVSIGVPILLPDASAIIRGPRINIPESIYSQVTIDDEAISKWAEKGWVDLRSANMKVWQRRFERMLRGQRMLDNEGTASNSRSAYLHDSIEIGTVVAWIFANEEGGFRIK